jgi:hypothetical protein
MSGPVSAVRGTAEDVQQEHEPLSVDVPAYHDYLGYRLDARALSEAAKRRYRDALAALLQEDRGGDDWLEGQLQRLCEIGRSARLDLLVATWEHEEFALWTLVDNTIFVRQVVRQDDGTLALEEASNEGSFYDNEKEEDPEPELAELAYAAIDEAELADLAARLLDGATEELT